MSAWLSNVTRSGEERNDTVAELLKYLRYRYEITDRALYHKTKLAYDAMLGKLWRCGTQRCASAGSRPLSGTRW